MSETIVLELTMHAVRLARSGNYRRLKELRKALEEDFPEALPAQVNEALKKLSNYYMESR